MDNLKEKLTKELDTYIDSLRTKSADTILNNAYELVVKQEIYDHIIFDNNYTKEEEKVLLCRKNLLDDLYNDWLNTDGNLRESLSYSVDDYVIELIDECKEKIKTKNDAR